jgi:hypothetical protein
LYRGWRDASVAIVEGYQQSLRGAARSTERARAPPTYWHMPPFSL